MEDDGGARGRILAARAEAVDEIADLGRRIAEIVDARSDANSDDEHDPEGATLAFERSQVDALRAAAARRREAADAALARLDAGAYGTCAICGGPIAAGRLEVRPLTDRCIRHA